MIEAIIIDDEKHCIDRLSYLLNEHCTKDIKLRGAYQTIEEGEKAIEKYKPGLVFLDVLIHENTGFDLLKKLDKIEFAVIFTTAFEKYAVQAFKFSAVDYLLKPIDAEDLRQSVLKVKEEMSKNDIISRMDVLFNNLQQRTSKKNSYTHCQWIDLCGSQ